jgi:hypothetical protein
MPSPVDRSAFDALRERAFDALVDGRAADAAPLLEQLTAIDPHNPGLHELHLSAVIMNFHWPAERAPARLEPRSPPRDDMVDIVLFHADPPAAAPRQQPSGYIAMAAMAFEAARARAPAARRVLLTDRHTLVPPMVGAHEIIRHDIDHGRLMYERMRVQRKYLESRGADRVSAMTDVDVVANRNPTEIFAEEFDIGLTWRSKVPHMPFNGGVLFAGSGARAVAFFDAALKCWDALSSDAAVATAFKRDLRHWWGDQFVLAILIGYREFAQRQSEAASIDGVKVRFFPCDAYNFAPTSGTNYQQLADRRFLHFKGARKSSLPLYIRQMRDGKI